MHVQDICNVLPCLAAFLGFCRGAFPVYAMSPSLYSFHAVIILSCANCFLNTAHKSIRFISICPNTSEYDTYFYSADWHILSYTVYAVYCLFFLLVSSSVNPHTWHRSLPRSLRYMVFGPRGFQTESLPTCASLCIGFRYRAY